MLLVYKDFELIGALTGYTSLEWTREYAGCGKAVLTLPFDADIYKLLAPNNVLYKRDTDDAAIIKDINITRQKDGSERLTVTAFSPEFILTDRVLNYYGSLSLQQTINALIEQNITVPANANRKMDSFRIVTNTVNPITDAAMDTVLFEQCNLFDVIANLAEQYSIGFKVRYNFDNKTYDFYLYEGRKDTNVIFSRYFNNVFEQDYYLNESEYKNTVMVGTKFINDENKGLDRHEIYVSPNSNNTSLETQGKLFLQDYIRRETFDTVIDAASGQYKYLTDWDLGDTVWFKEPRWGLNMQKRVAAVTEYTDRQGKHLTAIFGDMIPTIGNRLNKLKG